jgi:hypothetical protein
MKPINLKLYDHIRKNDFSKDDLYKILLSETFRWSQNFKNWCIKRNLSNVLNSIFCDTNIDGLSIYEVSKKLYDFCLSSKECIICKKLAKYRNFSMGYDKTCSYKCAMLLNSKQRCGLNNPYFRTPKKTLDRVHKEQSILMKKKILNGDFTPCVTNSWANSRCKIKFDDVEYKFRSTWEGMFWLITKYEYEKIRIPYINEKGENSTYIVDFVDRKNKVLYEIKPNSMKNNIRNKLKEKFAKEWCLKNDFKYEYISDDFFIKNKNIIISLTNNVKILKQLERICV